MTIKYNELMGEDAEDAGGYIIDRLKGFIEYHRASSAMDIHDLPEIDVYELVEELVEMIGWWEEEDEE